MGQVLVPPVWASHQLARASLEPWELLLQALCPLFLCHGPGPACTERGSLYPARLAASLSWPEPPQSGHWALLEWPWKLSVHWAEGPFGPPSFMIGLWGMGVVAGTCQYLAGRTPQGLASRQLVSALGMAPNTDLTSRRPRPCD